MLASLMDKFVGSMRLGPHAGHSQLFVIFSQKFIVVSGIPRLLLSRDGGTCLSPEILENFRTSCSDAGTKEKLLMLKKWPRSEKQ